jgi:hypothetical protein
MSTSKLKKAMLAKGHAVKASHLTVYMYSMALRHKDKVLATVEGSDNCLRALAVATSTNMWAATYLNQALDYTNIIVQGIPTTLEHRSYTDLRNKLRQLRYAVQILIYLQKSLQVFGNARLNVYTAALSWNKDVDRELFSAAVVQGKIIANRLAGLHTMLEDFIDTYHTRLMELKDAHKNSK